MCTVKTTIHGSFTCLIVRVNILINKNYIEDYKGKEPLLEK